MIYVAVWMGESRHDPEPEFVFEGPAGIDMKAAEVAFYARYRCPERPERMPTRAENDAAQEAYSRGVREFWKRAEEDLGTGTAFFLFVEREYGLRRLEFTPFYE